MTVLSGIRRQRRLRRPTGAPPPLPRKLGLTGKLWILLFVVMCVGATLLMTQPTLLRLSDHAGRAVLEFVANLRTDWLTRIVRWVDTATRGWAIASVGAAGAIALMILRRWRHLVVFIVTLGLIEQVGTVMLQVIAKPRPYGVEIIGNWGGYSMPSPSVTVVAAIVIGLVYTLVVPGRARTLAKLVALPAIGIVAFTRLYLAVDHPGAVLFGVAYGVTSMVIAFRLFCPNEVFPVVYRRGKTAHLDVTGRRAEAITTAVRDQLGLTVLDIKPVGLAGSCGSTPLRLCIAGEPNTYVFAKLYAKGHVRADRWYKLWRTILYGKLEDESPFQTVRRLVEYEDYTLRLLQDYGIETAAPFGIVEITPECEYMLVTEFFDGACEISEADVDDRVIHSGLRLIRDLWDAGIAHRDIKPANLLVRDGNVLLIDVFFVQVRPSPWRQAVDLGNMMLVLAVKTDVPRVYRIALEYFTPDELAEAFAATRGVASPTQLRAQLKQDGRNLLAAFRAMAPARDPIVLQRWSVRRVYTALATFIVLLFMGFTAGNVFGTTANLPVNALICGTSRTMLLAAQAVPSASHVPCIDALPAGWRVGRTEIHSGGGSFTLGSDHAGSAAVSLAFAARCDISGAEPTVADEFGTKVWERGSTRYYTYRGGCTTYRFDFVTGAPATVTTEVEQALGFTSRMRLVEHLRETEGIRLCGFGAPCGR